MKRTIAAVALAILAVTGLVGTAWAQDEPVDPRILAYDKGPSKIDTSKYPAEMQANYKVYVAKCSKCHTIARAINCDLVLEDEWDRYIKRMIHRAPDQISQDEGRKILAFVNYDSKTRKKALYEKKKANPPTH